MIAVIGGGLTGLSAAIRLAGQGEQVELFEAADQLGGRTRSFYEPAIGQLCDNGPHLLIGAYEAVQRLMADCHAASNIHWQDSLELPLWDKKRGLFCFRPSGYLPFPMALIAAVSGLPGHNMASSLAMLRLGKSLQSGGNAAEKSVSKWLAKLRIPAGLAADLLEPICLGAMNEAMSDADAASFQLVLSQAFANRMNARLGWFTGPMSEALIRPLADRAGQLGVRIHHRHLVRALVDQGDGLQLDGQRYDAAILAMPAYATDRLLGLSPQAETRMITNIHFWFDKKIPFPAPFVGGLGTSGHWFFDVSVQMQQHSNPHHICAVISAGIKQQPSDALTQSLSREIAAICGVKKLPPLVHQRVVCEKRATVLVRPRVVRKMLPSSIIDASERPAPGELPATIESAIRRGEKAAETLILSRL